ncbi:MAG TPA: nitronate monooxygenase [Caulobacteraceae bacterium]|nr:nitronate monooxygenase [Caulobacteraceae bacterium]
MAPFPNLRLPVIVAPMFLVSGVELTVAACQAGLVGSFPASNARDAAGLASWLGQIREALADDAAAAPFAVNINLQKGRYADHDAMVAACEAARAPLVITSVGDPTEIVERVHGWGGQVFHDVTTVRHAEKAVEAGVDGLILVCAGAGGHSGAASPFSLLPRVRRFFDRTLVLAGGVADGAGIAAARMLGADLVYMGTRFIASAESLAADDYKRMLIETDISDVIYTPAISGLPANFLRPSIAAAGMDPDALPPLKGPRQADLPEGVRAWKHVWSGGQAVGLIDDAPPVAVLVDRLEAEMRQAQAAFLAPARRMAALPA